MTRQSFSVSMPNFMAIGMFALAVSLVGCGGSQPSNPPPPATSLSAKPAVDEASDLDESTATAEAAAGDTAQPVEEPADSDRGWGSLKGRLVYDGKAPVPRKLIVDQNKQFCGQHPLVDESLVLGPNGGLVNVVVSIRIGRGDTKLEVHPNYAVAANAKVVVDNVFCRFDPHVVTIRTGQTLVLKNSDMIAHNMKADFLTNDSFNVVVPAQNVQEVQLSQAERLPAKIGCNIHPWMNAYLIVRDDPYVAVSAADGTFEIKDIPSGEHEFHFWQEKAGNLKDITLPEGNATSRRGRVNLTIPTGGELDLGDIMLSPELFTGR